MKRILIPYFEDNISNVFDFSQNFLLLTFDKKTQTDRTKIKIKETTPLIRVEKIKSLNINLIICGAISRKSILLFKNNKINIVSNITGNIDKVLDAYFDEEIMNLKYLLPGCQHGKPYCSSKKRNQRGQNNLKKYE